MYQLPILQWNIDADKLVVGFENTLVDEEAWDDFNADLNTSIMLEWKNGFIMK